jgi:hypothetical protein
MFRNTVISILVLVISAPCFAQSNERQLAVTARYAASKKARQHAYRMQIQPNENSISILSTGALRIPKSLKSIRFENGEKISRSAILEQAEESLDSTYHILEGLQPALSYKIPLRGDYEKQREYFLSGRRTPAYFGSQWILLQEIPGVPKKKFTFKTRGLFRTHHQYQVDYLPASTAGRFPAIDPWLCEPAELRFFQLRKLQGYGVGKFRYISYETPKRFIIRKTFDVYFKHNETNPDPAGISFATTYLEQNEFEILKAELEGGCSIEGTLERNQYLQHARARVLQRALHQFSSKKLKKDTVMLVDVMKQFRTEVEKTPHKWINKLNNDSILALVNANDSLRAVLEPVFQIQRKASLHLVIAKKLTSDEQYNKLIADMMRWSNRYHAKLILGTETEARLMGMIEKLFEYHEDGYIDAKEYSEALELTGFPGYLKILTAYHLLKRYEENTWPEEKAKTWDDYWILYNVESWLSQAQTEAVRMLELNIAQDDRTKIARMLTDFQAYTYEFIERGLIDINTLCHFPYPQKPFYLGLILNQYAFMYEMAARRNIPVNCISPSQCIRRDTPPKDSTVNIDRFIESVSAEHPVQGFQLIGEKLIREKNFDLSPKSAYYFLLKEYFLQNNAGALAHVQYSNGTGDVAFNIYNLWHLISINVERWNPFENHFYDSAVQIDQMEKLIGIMKKLDKNICKPQVNGLYLDYYLKLLYHLQRYPEPGNPKHAKYTDAAMKFLTNYYKTRAKNITPRLSLHITKQLNDFNWLPGSNVGAWYGYDLLNTIANTRLLNDEEMKLYAHYLQLFNPQMKKVPKVGFQKEKLMELWQEVY